VIVWEPCYVAYAPLIKLGRRGTGVAGAQGRAGLRA
jgi:hypothetical protein